MWIHRPSGTERLRPGTNGLIVIGGVRRAVRDLSPDELAGAGWYRIAEEAAPLDHDPGERAQAYLEPGEVGGPLCRRSYPDSVFNPVRCRERFALAVNERRKAAETAGIVVGEQDVPTGREDQAMLAGARQYVQMHPEAVIDWKNPDGSFTPLDAAAVEALASAVGAHVQACFTREKELLAELAALPGDEAALEAFALDEGWPDAA